MKNGYLPWAKKEQTGKPINLQVVIDDYWSSKMRDFTVPGESHDSQPVCLYLIEKCRGHYRWEI